MKKLLFTLFSIVCVSLYGQDFLASIPVSYAADTSMVRWYRSQVCVLYTGSASNGNHFHLVNMGSGDIYSVEVEEDVTDMEILDDTLYYCGKLNGYFPILYLFPLQHFYNANVNVKGRKYTPIKDYYPKKLEVFRVTGGVHAVVVGDIVNVNRTDGFIADFWRAGTSAYWETEKLLYTDDKECYDDIAVTDNYVVASGQVVSNGEIVLRVLDKPVCISSTSCTTNYDIFDNCNTTNTCEYTTYNYNGNDRKKIGGHGVYPVSITHTSGDHVVIACMVEESSSTGISAKCIKINTGGVPYVIRNICAWPGNTVNSYSNVREIRYDSQSDTLLMLVDMLHATGQNSGIAKIDNAVFSSLYYTYPTMPVASYSIHSIDRGDRWGLPTPGYNVYGKICSGTKTVSTSGFSGIWSDALSSDACSETDTLGIKDGTGKMALMRLPAPLFTIFNCYNVNNSHPVTHTWLDLECGYRRNNSIDD